MTPHAASSCSLPLLYPDLITPRPQLCSRQFLHIPHRIIAVTFDTHFLTETIVEDHFDHHGIVGTGCEEEEEGEGEGGHATWDMETCNKQHATYNVQRATRNT